MKTTNAISVDVWNGMVKVEDSSSNVLVTYSYDPFGRRITETPTGQTTKDLFFNTAGNVIEEQQAGITTDQYVWGLGSQNSLVLRDDNSTSGSYGKSGSGLGERLFIQQDPSGSVTSLVDTSGTVKERFVYDPYGAVTVVDPTNWNQTTDSYNWLYKFQGGRQDPTSGLVHFGTPGRDYSTTLGRWAQVDRSGYIAGANLYAADGSDPTTYSDPSGADPIFLGMAGMWSEGLVGAVAESGGDGSDLGDSGGGAIGVNDTGWLEALGRAESQGLRDLGGKLTDTGPAPNPPPWVRPRPTQPGVVTPFNSGGAFGTGWALPPSMPYSGPPPQSAPGGIPGNPIPSTRPSKPTVYMCQREPHILGGGLAASVGKYHQWIVIVLPDGTRIARGMGNGVGVPGQNGQTIPDMPFSETFVQDHSGEPTDHAILMPNEDVNELLNELKLGRPTGRWVPFANDCNTFTRNTLRNADTSRPHLTPEQQRYWWYMWRGLAMPM